MYVWSVITTTMMIWSRNVIAASPGTKTLACEAALLKGNYPKCSQVEYGAQRYVCMVKDKDDFIAVKSHGDQVCM